MSFLAIASAPRIDPILLAFQGFAADPRPGKVNLSVGMYYDAEGRVPLPRAVAEAEAALAARGAPWPYGFADGVPAFRSAAARLLFGAELLAEIGPRLATMQAPGGTGALRLAAEVVAMARPGTTAALSRPTWLNHAPILEAAGLRLGDYAYYDPATGGVDVPAMLRDLEALPTGSLVVLHACCHNPTGADLPAEAWEAVAATLAARGHAALLDIAYAGFGDGLDADLRPARLLARAGVPLLVAMSFSKSFALYGERVGLLAVVAGSAAEARGVVDAATGWTRTLYSTPPAHGAMLVAEILSSPALEAAWRAELEGMRARILEVRAELLRRAGGNEPGRDLGYLVRQKGLFSYTGLSAAQMRRLREEFAVHAVEDGRICVAAVNPANLGRVAEGLRAVAA